MPGEDGNNVRVTLMDKTDAFPNYNVRLNPEEGYDFGGVNLMLFWKPGAWPVIPAAEPQPTLSVFLSYDKILTISQPADINPWGS